MTYDRALALAQRCANRTGSSTIVYLATHNLELPEEVRYGYDFTLPLCGKRIGNRIYPQDAANRNAVLNRTASEYGNDEIRWPDGLQNY